MKRMPFALVAALVTTVALASPAVAGAYLRLSEIAERYGLTADVDLITGRTVLTDGQNRVALLPGGYQVLVNGRFAMLEERVGSERGDLIVPASALAFIDANLIKRAVEPSIVAAAARPATVAAASAGVEPGPAAAVVAGSAGTIVIDPGHGGEHTGCRGRSGVVEKEVNLGIALIVRDLLEARGWRVIMTRRDDRHLDPEVNADLDARVAVANRARADLFVSIHTNYAESAAVRGFEVFCARGRARDLSLARAIERSLGASTDDEDRGVKTAGFRVLKGARVPAVLVEVGFASHPQTERRLKSEAYRRTLAEAIVRGIERFSGSGGTR